MAKIRPIRGLDSDIENIAMTKAETIIIRDEAIDKVEVLSLQEQIYSSIKRITMTLGFSVKEVQFCKRMIKECEDISLKDFPKEDLESIERDKQDYIEREKGANKKIVSKAIELNVEITNLEELKKHKSKYLTDDIISNLDRMINEIEEFKKSLEIDDIENSEIYNEIEEEKENDDFVDLEAFLGIPTVDDKQHDNEVETKEIEEEPLFNSTPEIETLI